MATSVDEDQIEVVFLHSESTKDIIKWPLVFFFLEFANLVAHVEKKSVRTEGFVLIVPIAVLEQLVNSSPYHLESVRHIYAYCENLTVFKKMKENVKDPREKIRYWNETKLESLFEKLKADNAINSTDLRYQETARDVASSSEQRISDKRPNATDGSLPQAKRHAPSFQREYNTGTIQNIDSRYICPFCAHLFRKPYQLECGHRICSCCIKNEHEETVCVKCLQNSSNKNIWYDRGFQKEIQSMYINCSSCDWSGPFGSYECHIEQKHSDGSNDVTTVDVNTQRTIQSATSESAVTTQNSSVHHLSRYAFLRHIQDVLVAFISHVFILSNRQRRLADEFRQHQTSLQTLYQNLFALQRLTEETNQRVYAARISQQIFDQDIWSLKQAISNASSTSYDGCYIWKIENVQERIADARSERQQSIYSPPFHTSPYGYKMRLRLYLTGDADVHDEFMSVYLVIMKGDYDAILQWPFAFKVAVRLIDQSAETDGQRHIIDSFRPDITSTSCARPTSDMNHGIGIKNFYSYEKFERNKHRYVKEDTMLLEVKVDLLGTETPNSSSSGVTPNDEEHVATRD